MNNEPHGGNDPLSVKSMAFAIRIVRLCRHLAERRKEFVLSKQLLRSGTSVGANVSEARYAVSKKEFAVKMAIALKEAAETEYWIRLLRETEYLDLKGFTSIMADCRELIRLLIATVKTTRRGMPGSQ